MVKSFLLHRKSWLNNDGQPEAGVCAVECNFSEAVTFEPVEQVITIKGVGVVKMTLSSTGLIFGRRTYQPRKISPAPQKLVTFDVDDDTPTYDVKEAER